MHPLLLLVTWAWFMSQILCSDLSNFLTQLPSCAESCVLDFVSASSCGTNAACLCTDPKLKDDVLPCVESHCLPRDALATINLTSVACDFPIRDKHEQFNILTITLIVITGVTVGLRFVEKIRYGPGLQVDDYVITGAFLVNLGNSIVCLHGLSGNGLGRDAWRFSPDTITSYLCFLYAGQTLYATDVFATKICVLLFYLRIFPGVVIRRLIWGTVGIAVLCMVIFDLLALFQCQPISFYWKGWDQLHKGHCIGINGLAWAIAAVGIILDLWMLAIPISQLIHLQMKWKRKLAVASMFGVGTFVTVVSILRLRYLVAFGNSSNPTWDSFDTCYWSVIELNVGIWCACMPNLRVLMLKTFPRLQSSVDATPRSHQYNSSTAGRPIRVSSNTQGLSDNTMYRVRSGQGRKVDGSSSTAELVEMTRFTNETRSSLA
ncbi:related to integral membrane protein PTH11 [Fusarium fujikuroi]|nr:related to integral membrane protein PTH11 [Fusarium fujikuroi]SCO58516.1 related to integral membrane protein PTH11 [Fusarium fujikuroi]